MFLFYVSKHTKISFWLPVRLKSFLYQSLFQTQCRLNNHTASHQKKGEMLLSGVKWVCVSWHLAHCRVTMSSMWMERQRVLIPGGSIPIVCHAALASYTDAQATVWHLGTMHVLSWCTKSWLLWLSLGRKPTWLVKTRCTASSVQAVWYWCEQLYIAGTLNFVCLCLMQKGTLCIWMSWGWKC